MSSLRRYRRTCECGMPYEVHVENYRNGPKACESCRNLKRSQRRDAALARHSSAASRADAHKARNVADDAHAIAVKLMLRRG